MAMRSTLFYIFLLCTLGATHSHASDPCATTELEATLRYTEGKGIGYRSGYTTLEFLWIPSYFECRSLFPIIDIRGHGFSNRKLAANAGIGVRYLSSETGWIFGTNVYYDVRQGSHRNLDQVGHAFQQMGIGFEALSSLCDFRVNYYHPIAQRASYYSQDFLTVVDSVVTQTTILSKQQLSMTGMDAEVGTSLAEGYFKRYCIDWNVYVAGGAYYLKPLDEGGYVGGKARLAAYFKEYFFFEMRASYDHVNLGRFQLRAGIDLPLYPNIASYRCFFENNDNCCNLWSLLRDMVFQPVERAEIMPLKTRAGCTPPIIIITPP